MAKTDPEIKLNGEGAWYVAAVLSVYNLILVHTTMAVNWNGSLDSRERLPCFVISDA